MGEGYRERELGRPGVSLVLRYVVDAQLRQHGERAGAEVDFFTRNVARPVQAELHAAGAQFEGDFPSGGGRVLHVAQSGPIRADPEPAVERSAAEIFNSPLRFVDQSAGEHCVGATVVQCHSVGDGGGVAEVDVAAGYAHAGVDILHPDFEVERVAGRDFGK